MSRGGANKPKVGSHKWKAEVRCETCDRVQTTRNADGRNYEFVAPCDCGGEVGSYAHPLPETRPRDQG